MCQDHRRGIVEVGSGRTRVRVGRWRELERRGEGLWRVEEGREGLFRR